jgi:Protein kinase domain
VKAAVGPGELFAGYRVESLVGRGGMGVVYRATDLSLDRPVALKLIAPELAQDKRFRERFLREPRLAAALDHPHVIPIYEAGEHDGQLYLAMRFVEGSDLKTVLEQEGRLPPERALKVLGQVAGALDAAHRRALVHRDVKPANVLIDTDGHAYLTDFGITKQVGGASTDTGRMVGTLDYLAPEQIRGDPVDGRTDVYALGCLLYECLSGAPPFRRATEAETLWAHMQDEPAPRRDQPALDPVLHKALAKNPDERYGSCVELIDAAGAALGLAAPGGRAAARRARRRHGRLLLAGGLITGPCGGGCRHRRPDSRRSLRHGPRRQRGRCTRGHRRAARIVHQDRRGPEQPRGGSGRRLGTQPRGPDGCAHRPGDEAGREEVQDTGHPDRHCRGPRSALGRDRREAFSGRPRDGVGHEDSQAP